MKGLRNLNADDSLLNLIFFRKVLNGQSQENFIGEIFKPLLIF